MVTDGIDEFAEVIFRQFGFRKTLDVFVVSPTDEIGMEKGVIPMLELDAKRKLREILGNFLEVLDNPDSVTNITHVIVSHLQYK